MVRLLIIPRPLRLIFYGSVCIFFLICYNPLFFAIDERKIIVVRTFQHYYSSEQEFCTFHRSLRLIPCPHCGKIGALVLNGRLYGYEECSSTTKKILRGRKIFCNNRKVRNNGCGRSVCILAAGVIRNFTISASSLWRFLEGVEKPSDRLACFRQLEVTHDESAAYRLYKRFTRRISFIRSMLGKLCVRVNLPAAGSAVTQTIAHLRAVFKKEPCPIAAFQHRFGVSLL